MFTSYLPDDCGPGYPTNQHHMCRQHSFLSYVATDNTPAPPGAKSCNASTNGMVKVKGMPAGALLALGQDGKYMIVNREERLVIVAFMATYASLKCDGGAAAAWSTAEGLILSQVWGALANATTPTGERVVLRVSTCFPANHLGARS